ncbi:MAG: hypothetical protein M3P08_04400 [Thermoproteota archaeon]|nr:hypothetical protein [Thermoproteota archaeon]
MSYAATQTLPSCTDPTGQNLPCLMVISTLPPPPNLLQCKETSGQILACSYATQYLSNGEQIVVITVYVPANFVFIGGPVSVVKVVHETTTKITGGGSSPYALSVTIKIGTDPIIRGHIETIKVMVSDKSNPSMKIAGAKVSGELFYPSGFHKSISCSTTNQNGESQCSFIIGPNSNPGKFRTTVQVSANGYKPTSKSATFTVITKTNTTSLANATIPINVTNTTSTNLTNPSNMSSMIFKPPSNTSAAIQPSNTSIPTSGGGKGKGTTCAAGNCTSGTAPPVDCTKNPTDPSCTQSLTPSTSTPPLTSVPPSTPPTTKTCPDGSVIDASANCPTQSTPPTNPNTPSAPPSTSGTPPSNNPSPPSSGGGGSSSGSGGSGSGSGGGSSPPQPTTGS